MDQNAYSDQPIDQYGVENLALDSSSTSNIRETAKWGRFMSIVSFVFIGLLVLMVVFFGAFISAAMFGELSPQGGGIGFLMILYYVVVAALYFIPTYFLYKFSTTTLRALASGDSEKLSSGFSNLKSLFKFMGIMTIIFLGLGVIMVLFTLIAGGAAFL